MSTRLPKSVTLRSVRHEDSLSSLTIARSRGGSHSLSLATPGGVHKLRFERYSFEHWLDMLASLLSSIGHNRDRIGLPLQRTRADGSQFSDFADAVPALRHDPLLLMIGSKPDCYTGYPVLLTVVMYNGVGLEMSLTFEDCSAFGKELANLLDSHE